MQVREHAVSPSLVEGHSDFGRSSDRRHALNAAHCTPHCCWLQSSPMVHVSQPSVSGFSLHSSGGGASCDGCANGLSVGNYAAMTTHGLKASAWLQA